MKRWFSPSLIVAAAAALWNPAALRASDILWQATGSGAWITGANWAGGVMPGAGDVAQFGNTGPGAIGVALWNPNYTPKGEAHVGAIALLSDRVTRDLVISGNANSTSTFYMEGATLNGIADTILLNESGRSLTLAADTPTYSRQMSVALRPNENHVVQATGSGGVTIQAPITGSQARLTIAATGSGAVTLSGTGSTYSGGTFVQAGRLIIAGPAAAGTGGVAVAGGTLQVNAGVAFTNAVTLSQADARYQRLYGAGDAYQTFAAQSGLGTQAAILGGSAAGARTLSAGFQTAALAGNDAWRVSDVFELDGMGGDIFVLELQLGEGTLSAGSFLAWLDGDQWVNATLGNSSLGQDAVQAFNGTFGASGAFASADYLGSWGYDPATGSVWAVLDHNSAFAVAVPEPGAALLLGFGVVAAWGCRKLRA